MLFLGDSITEQWTTVGRTAWQELLAPVGAESFGISGDRTQHLLWRIQNGGYGRLRPKLIVLLIGTNNLKNERNTVEETVSGIRRVVEATLAQTNADVLLLGILPCGPTLDSPERRRAAGVNRRLSTLCFGERVAYADVGAALLSPGGMIAEETMPDFLHPSAEGYRLLAKAVAPIVKHLLPQDAYPADQRMAVRQEGDRLIVSCKEKPFAEYRPRSGGQPAVWPVVGPTGLRHTRAYPVGEAASDERRDHPHHRSLWFAHGDVNGHDFWHGSPSASRPEIVHQGFSLVHCNGSEAKIVAENDWVVGDRVICSDERTLLFTDRGAVRWIDFRIRLTACNGPVTFGDTKEGTFAVRVAGSMKADASEEARIVNSLGKTGDEAWGLPAAWVDYSGPIGDQRAGITIFCSPDNPRHPCRWHVRSYGLFAANPFGVRDFPEVPSQSSAPLTLAGGESTEFHYSVLLHNGKLSDADIEAAYAAHYRDKQPKNAAGLLRAVRAADTH